MGFKDPHYGSFEFFSLSLQEREEGMGDLNLAVTYFKLILNYFRSEFVVKQTKHLFKCHCFIKNSILIVVLTISCPATTVTVSYRPPCTNGGRNAALGGRNATQGAHISRTCSTKSNAPPVGQHRNANLCTDQPQDESSTAANFTGGSVAGLIVVGIVVICIF